MFLLEGKYLLCILVLGLCLLCAKHILCWSLYVVDILIPIGGHQNLLPRFYCEYMQQKGLNAQR